MEQKIETAEAKPKRRYARRIEKTNVETALSGTTKETSATKGKPAKAKSALRVTKAAIVTGLLARPTGATIAQMCEATGWQQHSVRGFLAGKVKKMPGASLASDRTEAGRIYRLTTNEPVTA